MTPSEWGALPPRESAYLELAAIEVGKRKQEKADDVSTTPKY